MNDNEKQALVDLLHACGGSCVIRSGDEVRIFRQRGVRDLFVLLHDEPRLLQGAFVADKVVGKGAAALMILGQVGELFADVVSEPALALLRDAGLSVSYSALVPHIVDRTGTGFCPIETLCAECRTAQECLPLIDGFLRQSSDLNKKLSFRSLFI